MKRRRRTEPQPSQPMSPPVRGLLRALLTLKGMTWAGMAVALLLSCPPWTASAQQLDAAITLPAGRAYLYLPPSGQYTRALVWVTGYDPLGLYDTQDGSDTWNSEFQPFLYDTWASLGYAVWIVDFDDGAAAVEDNIETALSAFQYAAFYSGDEVPVAAVGYSMGGLVTRYALANAEGQGIDHKVDLFVSWDAPQQGANVSKHLQAWATKAGGDFQATIDTDFARDTLYEWSDCMDDPASCDENDNCMGNAVFARIRQDTTATSAYHQDFYAKANAQNGDGYPDDPINVAVAHGSWQSDAVPDPFLHSHSGWHCMGGIVGHEGYYDTSAYDSAPGSSADFGFDYFHCEKEECHPEAGDEVYWIMFVQVTVFANYELTVETYDTPTFIPTESAIDYDPVSGTSPFDDWQVSNANGSHLTPEQGIVDFVVDYLTALDADGDLYTVDEGDCDDADPTVNPGANELACDGVDTDCDGALWPTESDDDGDGWTECEGDCDDADDAVAPDAPEIYCDGIDNDCDGEDLGHEIDDDGDGWSLCDDCDDTSVVIHPGAAEDVDGIDNDCDGTVDEGTAVYDDDGDGYAEADGDCNDYNVAIHPFAAEVEDALDNDCDGLVDEGTPAYDDDGDGVSEDGGDCDDANQAIYPGAPEHANGVDDDCDGEVDEHTDVSDDDGDGFAEMDGDCNDYDAQVYPGAVEIVDALDNDCDGIVDEGTAVYDDDGDGLSEDQGDCDDGNPAISPAEVEVVDGLDNDCDGDVDEDTDVSDDDGDGYTEGDGDCNDTFDFVYPTAPEVADGYDNDCDGVVDDGTQAHDDDGDGVSEMVGDCDDANPAVYPGHVELADGEDNDCDGLVDEDTDTYDDDGDGYSEATGDCNDHDVGVFPGATELVDFLDNDCDGLVDEGTEVYDDDGDGLSEMGGDCDDGNPAVHLGGEEIVDGLDNDCDGDTDEGTDVFDDDGDGFSETAGDCLDGSPAAYPGNVEVADGIDNDCNGLVDDQTEVSDDDGDGMTENGGDCNDGNASVFLGHPEVVDGLDNDCDGLVDEDTVAYDDDGDGYSEQMGDCNDVLDDVHPNAQEVVDGLDNDCDGIVDDGTEALDDDGDGVSEMAGDCDDANSDVFPGHAEIADGLDNDCDGVVDEDTEVSDDDGDGFSEQDGDCNDHFDHVHPGAIEDVDGLDEDCDGLVDEDTAVSDDDGDGVAESGGDCDDANPDVYPGHAEVADGQDNDCDGTLDEDTDVFDDDGDGFSEQDGDCADGIADVYPGNEERVDGLDNDCNGLVDDGTEVYDDDGDGLSEDGGDCDDANPSVFPGNGELVDGIDNDCDGVPDDGTEAHDDDGDGLSELDGDCNDTNPDIFPGAVELDDGLDNDCDPSTKDPDEYLGCECSSAASAGGPTGGLIAFVLFALAVLRRGSGRRCHRQSRRNSRSGEAQRPIAYAVAALVGGLLAVTPSPATAEPCTAVLVVPDVVDEYEELRHERKRVMAEVSGCDVRLLDEFIQDMRQAERHRCQATRAGDRETLGAVAQALSGARQLRSSAKQPDLDPVEALTRLEDDLYSRTACLPDHDTLFDLSTLAAWAHRDDPVEMERHVDQMVALDAGRSPVDLDVPEAVAALYAERRLDAEPVGVRVAVSRRSLVEVGGAFIYEDQPITDPAEFDLRVDGRYANHRLQTGELGTDFRFLLGAGRHLVRLTLPGADDGPVFSIVVNPGVGAVELSHTFGDEVEDPKTELVGVLARQLRDGRGLEGMSSRVRGMVDDVRELREEEAIHFLYVAAVDPDPELAGDLERLVDRSNPDSRLYRIRFDRELDPTMWQVVPFPYPTSADALRLTQDIGGQIAPRLAGTVYLGGQAGYLSYMDRHHVSAGGSVGVFLGKRWSAEVSFDASTANEEYAFYVDWVGPRIYSITARGKLFLVRPYQGRVAPYVTAGAVAMIPVEVGAVGGVGLGYRARKVPLGASFGVDVGVTRSSVLVRPGLTVSLYL